MKIKIFLFIIAFSISIIAQSQDVYRFIEFPTKIVNVKRSVISKYSNNEYYFYHELEFKNDKCMYFYQVMRNCGKSKFEDIREYFEKRRAHELYIANNKRIPPHFKFLYKNLIYVAKYDRTERTVLMYVRPYTGASFE